jgi:hypothetical protein
MLNDCIDRSPSAIQSENNKAYARMSNAS